jgi:hypothetical protein
MSNDSNPRGAGRKPTGIIKTHHQVTVWPGDYEAYMALENCAMFVRDAIAEKLERDRMASQQTKPL